MQEEPPEVELMNDLVRDDLAGLVVDLADVPYSQMLGEAVDGVPVLRTVYGLARVGLTMRDQLFVRRLIACYREAGAADAESRRRLLEGLDDPRDARLAGELLLGRLEAASDTNRAALIGRVFAYCARTSRPWHDFERMTEMIVAAYSSDLRYFFKRGRLDIGDTGDEVERLIALGFYMRPLHQFGDQILQNVRPQVSSYGEAVLSACR